MAHRSIVTCDGLPDENKTDKTLTKAVNNISMQALYLIYRPFE